MCATIFALFVPLWTVTLLLVKSQRIFDLLVQEVSMENLLSVEEAAKRLGGISKWAVHAWLSQGKLRRTKVGRRTMIRESELAKVVRDEENQTHRDRLKQRSQ